VVSTHRRRRPSTTDRNIYERFVLTFVNPAPAPAPDDSTDDSTTDDSTTDDSTTEDDSTDDTPDDALPGTSSTADSLLPAALTRRTDALWQRHANPKSGWSRVATLPVLMYGIYTRRPRLVAAALGFVVVNPVLFSPPDDADAWMTRVVLGERMYYRHRGSPGAVDLLNYANGPVTAYAVYAASRRRPVRTVVATALSMALKFLFVGFVARYYEANRERFPEDVPDFDRRPDDAA
jgi:hypothetical protein